MADNPYIVVIGGPNGAGKSTVAREVLAETFGVLEFVNADKIAEGLSGFEPEGVAVRAGRIMLERLDELARTRSWFALESTLSGRALAAWLERQAASGYGIYLVYVAVRSPELAIDRVQSRVQAGGHAIASDVIRRRYFRSAFNFLRLYMPIATSWRFYDNSGDSPQLAAVGQHNVAPFVVDHDAWNTVHEAAQAQAAELRRGGQADA